MNIVNLVRTATVLCSLACAPAIASAATISISKQGSSVFGSNASASARIFDPSLPSSGLGVTAGGFALKGDLNGDSIAENFTAWCLDISTYLNLPANYTKTTNPFTSDVLTTVQKTNIERLFETAYSSLNLSIAAQSAGFQLALWEIIYEAASSPLSLLTGIFQASNSQDAINFAQTLLGGLNGAPTKDYTLIFLEATPHSSQNLVTIVPAPIPTALPLLMTGIAAVGLWGRRRRRLLAV